MLSRRILTQARGIKHTNTNNRFINRALAGFCNRTPQSQPSQYFARSLIFHRSFAMTSQPSPPSSASNAFQYFPDPYDFHHLLDGAKLSCADIVLATLSAAFPDVKDLNSQRNEIASKIVRPSQPGRGELSMPCFTFNKKLDPALTLPPPAMAAKLQEVIQAKLAQSNNPVVERVEVAAAYLNFYLTPKYLASVLPSILDGSFLAPLKRIGQPKVMIEYSQPNTHKAFHVGHMRNAALGDCLVRLYEQMGHEVVAANYFGDEGAHVAKCLWWLKRYMKENPAFELDSIPVEQRGEWLGGYYSEAVEQLDLGLLTQYPFPSIVPAKVLTISPHPNEKAPKNWNVVTLQVSEDVNDVKTVVCGGIGYNVNDYVAYTPIGSKVKSVIVDVKDMMGVSSAGIMMAEKELGIETKVEEIKTEEKENVKGGKKEKSNKSNKKDSSLTDAASQKIHKFPSTLTLGKPVTEAGRLPNANIAPGLTVDEEFAQRKSEVRSTLLGMEHGDKELVDLWQKTRHWSLDEFKRIYSWLNCRFDHDFFESEVSEESRLMAEEYKNNGTFIDSNGATGADLSSFGLGFCMVLKSDGSGLYATKDLALAKRKFDQFNIEESIYIVDAAQTLHFKQVFKTLELMGYQQAKHCIHIPYGQVVLPSGKMSSRAGNVILFSQLRKQLNDDIYNNFLIKYATNNKQPATSTSNSVNGDGEVASYTKTERSPVVWSDAELLNAQHAIAVASIKYGMLNHDTSKDIIFVMEEWTAKSGNTGPYMMYAYARISSIIREVKSQFPELINDSKELKSELLSLLTHDSERAVLTQIFDFWSVVESCTINNNPSGLCSYLFDLSKGFSSWYEKCSLLKAENPELREARLKFIEAIGAVIKRGLGLLGIRTIERM